MTNKL